DARTGSAKWHCAPGHVGRRRRGRTDLRRRVVRRGRVPVRRDVLPGEGRRVRGSGSCAATPRPARTGGVGGPRGGGKWGRGGGGPWPALFPAARPRFLERMPFSYHDPDVIVADLVAGGFVAPAAVERVEHRIRAASPEVVASAFCGGTPLRDELQAGGTDRLPGASAGTPAGLAPRLPPTPLPRTT